MPTVIELRKRAAKLGLKGYSRMNKAQLEYAVSNAKFTAKEAADHGNIHYMTVVNLRKRAGRLNIKGRSTMKKAQLIQEIRLAEKKLARMLQKM
jgi:hypothetical protein